MISSELLEQIKKRLVALPSTWDGKAAITEMRDADYPHWRQMEWIGFYFQFLCERALAPLMKIPGPSYGRVAFDGFAEIPWDFKAHPHKNAKGQNSDSVIVNDRLAILGAIKQYGQAGLILAIGDAEYNDTDRSFQIWHQELKGGLSEYERQRIERKAPSRLRKVAFKLLEIDIILLDNKGVDGFGSFQEGFRNSDGSPRNVKVLLNLLSNTPAIRIKFEA